MRRAASSKVAEARRKSRRRRSGWPEGRLPESAASGGLAIAKRLRVKAVEEFLRGGGTLVCFNRSSTFAIDQFKLPVKNVVAGVGRLQFFVGGSLLNVEVNTGHRVMYGMPTEAVVFYDSGPVFEMTDGFKGTVLPSYPQEKALPSGFLQVEWPIMAKPSALEGEFGEGRFVLLGFKPQWRGQPFGTFRVIFNADCISAGALDENTSIDCAARVLRGHARLWSASRLLPPGTRRRASRNLWDRWGVPHIFAPDLDQRCTHSAGRRCRVAAI